MDNSPERRKREGGRGSGGRWKNIEKWKKCGEVMG
jgi:hypothetical protein